MDLIAKAVERNTLKIVKRAAIAADQTAVLKTPVDTGRARANWIVTVGAPGAGTPVAALGPKGGKGKQGVKGQATNEALEKGRTTILEYKLGRGGIFITNNVPYIGELDAGSSAQAPKGMTADAVRAAEKQLGDARLLDGV
jgi:hypothetical protein